MKQFLFGGLVLMLAAGSGLSAPPAEPVLVKVPYYDDLVDVRIPVTLFGKPLSMEVDTGAEATFIDAVYREQLGPLLNSGTVNTISAAHVSMPVYAGPKLDIGGHVFSMEWVGCLNFDQLHAVSGTPFAGFLGMDVLQHYVITFDPDQRQFTIATNVPAAVKAQGQAIPLTPVDEHGALQLSAQANGTVSLNLELDSGENNFLALNPVDWDRVFHDSKEPVRENFIMGADAHVGRSKRARIQSLVINGIVYTNVIAESLLNPTVTSHIGYGFLKQYIATLDAPDRVLYLTPSHYFGEAQEEDMSGLHLIRLKEKILVYAVDPDSPAAQAGIKLGEELVTLNGQPVTSLSLQEVRQILRKQDGLAVTIKLRNDDKVEREVGFRLKRVI